MDFWYWQCILDYNSSKDYKYIDFNLKRTKNPIKVNIILVFIFYKSKYYITILVKY